MAALNDKQSKELCRKIEQHILKNGYFILDTDDWDGLHIEYKLFTHGKNYEYADYTEITVTLDGYNITDTFRVQYYFARNTLFSKQLGDNYTVYYTDKGVDHTGNDGRGTSLDEVADFIANRFIGLVEDKIMDKKLEARIARLEKLCNEMNDVVNVGSYVYVGDDEYLIIDKGTPDEMFAKYNKRLNATERGIYNDGEYNGLDTILVGQSGGMSTLLYFFREDDVDEIIYRDYFLSSVKFHLEKSINELKECSKSANKILTNERQTIADEIDKAMAILSDLKITCDSI